METFLFKFIFTFFRYWSETAQTQIVGVQDLMDAYKHYYISKSVFLISYLLFLVLSPLFLFAYYPLRANDDRRKFA